MRISDWSSDVCSSDLGSARHNGRNDPAGPGYPVPKGPQFQGDGGEETAPTAGNRTDRQGWQRDSQTLKHDLIHSCGTNIKPLTFLRSTGSQDAGLPSKPDRFGYRNG